MLYNHLKILHIIGASGLLMSLVYCFHQWKSPQNAANFGMISRHIQTQTAWVIIPCAVAQLITGFMMISLEHATLPPSWIRDSMIGFTVLIGSWIAFIYLLLQLESHKTQEGWQYTLLIRTQTFLAGICVIAFLSMIFLMANKP